MDLADKFLVNLATLDPETSIPAQGKSAHQPVIRISGSHPIKLSQVNTGASRHGSFALSLCEIINSVCLCL